MANGLGSLPQEFTSMGRRFFEIGEEETAAGLEQVKEGFKTHPGRLILPQSLEDLKRIGQIAQGALRAVYSPATAFWRAFYGEPAKNTAKQLGASEEASELIGLGVEITGFMLSGAAAGRAVNQVTPEYVKRAEALVKTPVPKVKKHEPHLPSPEELLAKQAETKLAGTNLGPVLRKINTPQDAQNAFLNTVKAVESQAKAARRGVITWEESENAARLLAVKPSQLMSRKVGQAFNVEQLEALKLMMRKASEEVTEAAKAAISGGDKELLAFKALRDKYVAVTKNFLGARAEAGRALNILRKEMAPMREGVLPQLAGETQDLLRQQARMLAEAPSPEAAARAMLKATTSDKLVETWINMLLSGPQTHAVNTLSNTLTGIWSLPEHTLAAGIGKLHRGNKVFLREPLARLYGWVEGAKDGLRLAKKAYLTEEPSDIFTKIEAVKPQALGGRLGKLTRIPTRALQAEDEFFKSIGYRMSVRQHALRKGLQEGRKGKDLARRVKELLDDPPEDIHLAGIDEARYLTFTKPLGEFGRAVLKMKHSHPAVNLVIPFVRTPTNIIKFAGERTPLAFFSQAVRNEIKKGGVARDLALARIGFGSMVGGVVTYQAAQGLITGGGPSDPDARRALYDTGWQPYSIKIGNKYHSYGRLEPLGILFGVSADLAEIAGYLSEEESENIASMIAASVSKNITNKTWLSGVSSVVEALSDPDRYMGTTFSRLAGTVVPTGVAQFTRTQDPILRDARTAIDRIKSRLPGYSTTVPAKLNLWGEPVVLEGGLGPDILSPIYTSVDKNDRLADEIVRLKLELGMPRRKISGVELTGEQYNEFVKLSGKPARRILDRLVQVPLWQNIPDNVKRELIKTQVEKWRRFGKAQMMMKYKDQLLLEPKKKEIKELSK